MAGCFHGTIRLTPAIRARFTTTASEAVPYMPGETELAFHEFTSVYSRQAPFAVKTWIS